eukprot:9050498-Pyramimonas_sp.AAC.1
MWQAGSIGCTSQPSDRRSRPERPLTVGSIGLAPRRSDTSEPPLRCRVCSRAGACVSPRIALASPSHRSLKPSERPRIGALSPQIGALSPRI